MDIQLFVKPTKDFIYVPDSLMIRLLNPDPVTKVTNTYFELTQSTPLDTTKYTSRDWIDRGTTNIPSAVLDSAYNTDGSINPEVINMVLSAFNLELDMEKMFPPVPPPPPEPEVIEDEPIEEEPLDENGVN